MSDTMRLTHASPAEIAAAIKVTHDNVSKLIDTYMMSGPASWFKQQAKDALESPNGKAWVTKLVDDALDAAQAVRDANNPAPPPPQAAA